MAERPRTRLGRPLDEAISALQKEIRRGNEANAMGFALELAPTCGRYLWKRLIVIALEDIGIADPDIHPRVRSLRESYEEFREKGKDGSARLCLATAVLMMCRAQKSRIADEFQCVIASEMAAGWMPPIEEYAVDKHTERGRAAGRDVVHWLTEGCMLSNEVSELNVYRQIAEERWKAGWKGQRFADMARVDDGPKQPGLFDDQE